MDNVQELCGVGSWFMPIKIKFTKIYKMMFQHYLTDIGNKLIVICNCTVGTYLFFAQILILTVFSLELLFISKYFVIFDNFCLS
jgi:hypothetical protein